MEHAKELEMQISKVEREIKFSSADENIFKKILCDSIEFMLQDGLRNYNSHEQTGFGKGHRIKSMNWKFFTSKLTAARTLISLLPNGGNQVVSAAWLKSIGVNIPTRYYVRKNKVGRELSKLSKLNLRKKNDSQEYTLEDYGRLVGLEKVTKKDVARIGEKLRRAVHKNLLLISSIDINNSITIDVETCASCVEIEIQYFVSILNNQGSCWEEILKKKDYKEAILRNFPNEKIRGVKTERIEL